MIAPRTVLLCAALAAGLGAAAATKALGAAAPAPAVDVHSNGGLR